MSINKVVLSGNLTREPELRMAGATPVLQFGLAVNERVKVDGEWTDKPNFFDVVVWGTRGESLSRILTKGSKVAIAGRLRWSQWEANDGSKRSKVEVVAEDVELMGDKPKASGYTEHQPVEVLGEDIPF